MTEATMTAEQRHVINLFLHGLTKLNTDDNGLKPGHDIEDLNVIAFLCLAVKAVTAACRTVEDILLYQLADESEALLVSSVIPTSDDVVGNWWKARVSVVNCQLGAIE
jgi:hypothetical protein